MPGPIVEKSKAAKLKGLRDLGINPYPYSFRRTNIATDNKTGFSSMEGRVASVAGRVMATRRMGGIVFYDVLDPSGKIQCLLREDAAGEDAWRLTEFVETGDIIGVTGKIMKTRDVVLPSR